MKILQISPYFWPYIGGSEGYCYQLSRRLAKRGHDVTVLTSRFRGDPNYANLMDNFRITRALCLGELLGTNPITPILHKLLKERFDAIHAHSYIFFTSNQAALARKLTHTPLLLHLHGGVDAFPSVRDFQIRLKFRIKSRIYDSTVGKWTTRAADAVASVSKRDMERSQTLWGLDGGKLHWVPNAVEPSEFSPHQYGNTPNVIFVGRLQPWKGIRALVEIVRFVRSQRNDVHFTIVGDGSLRKEIEGSLKMDRVTIVGNVPHERIPGLLANSSALILPSYMEGIPTVCLEASAAGIPVIASDVGGTSEVVVDGENGYLFDPGNVRSCAERIIEVLSDCALARRLGERGRELVETNYNWNQVVRSVEAIYEQIA